MNNTSSLECIYTTVYEVYVFVYGFYVFMLQFCTKDSNIVNLVENPLLNQTTQAKVIFFPAILVMCKNNALFYTKRKKTQQGVATKYVYLHPLANV